MKSSKFQTHTACPDSFGRLKIRASLASGCWCLVRLSVSTAANPQLRTYSNPFSTLSQGTNAVAARGTIYLNSSVQPSRSSEKMTIKKPLTIVSMEGPATMGN